MSWRGLPPGAVIVGHAAGEAVVMAIDPVRHCIAVRGEVENPMVLTVGDVQPAAATAAIAVGIIAAPSGPPA